MWETLRQCYWEETVSQINKRKKNMFDCSPNVWSQYSLDETCIPCRIQYDLSRWNGSRPVHKAFFDSLYTQPDKFCASSTSSTCQNLERTIIINYTLVYHWPVYDWTRLDRPSWTMHVLSQKAWVILPIPETCKHSTQNKTHYQKAFRFISKSFWWLQEDRKQNKKAFIIILTELQNCELSMYISIMWHK